MTPISKVREIATFPCFHSNQLLLQEYTKCFCSLLCAGPGPGCGDTEKKEGGDVQGGTDQASVLVDPRQWRARGRETKKLSVEEEIPSV